MLTLLKNANLSFFKCIQVNFFDCHTHNTDLNEFSIVNSHLQSIDSFHSIGIHPWNTNAENFDLKEFNQLITHPKCIAIGEIGLDKLKGAELRTQIRTFEQQVIFAEEYALPIIIHCVKAWNEIKNMKRSMNPKQAWIFHGFNKLNLLNEILAEGCLISLGHFILHSNFTFESIQQLPLDRILFETDDKKINISSIYQQYSELSGISLLDLSIQIEENFKNTFKKWQIG